MTASQVLDVAGAEPVRARFGFGDDELERITHWVDLAGDPLGLRRRPPQHLRPRRGLAPTPGRRAYAGSCWARRCPGSTTGRSSGTLPVDDVERRRPRARRPVRGARRPPPRLPRGRRVGRLGRRLDDRPGRRRPPAHRDTPGRRLAGGAVRPRAVPDRRRGGRLDDAAATGRRTRPAAPAAARTPDPLQLPHRHADGLHDGADALGPPPRGLPGRSRRRGVPAGRDRRRRRRPGPPTPHRRARPALRGPPAAPRRDRRGHRDAGHHLHRSRRAHRRGATARRAAGRAARRARPHRSRARAQPRRDPPPAAALRRGQLRRRRTAAGTTPSPSTGSRSPVRGQRAPTGPATAGARAHAPAGSRSPAGDVSLADLQDFFAHPVRGFFRRLRITKPYDADEVKDAIPITLDALEKWAVGDRPRRRRARWGRRRAVGEAPSRSAACCHPARSASGVLDEIVTVVRPLVLTALELRRGPPAHPRRRRRPRRAPVSSARSATSGATTSSPCPSPTWAPSTGWRRGSTRWPSPPGSPTRTGRPTPSASTAPGARSS